VLFEGFIILLLFEDFAFSKRLFILPFFKLLVSAGFLILFKLLLSPWFNFVILAESFFSSFNFVACLDF